MEPRRSRMLFLVLMSLLGALPFILLAPARLSDKPIAEAAPHALPLSSAPWSPDERVNDIPSTERHWHPDIAVDAFGNAYAVWTDYRNGKSDIYFSYRPKDGAWCSDERVTDDEPGKYYQWHPHIAVDALGNAYAVWGDSRYAAGWVPDQVAFSYRPAGGSWGTNVRVTDQKSSWGQIPDIAVDPSGNAYAVWQDFRRGDAKTDIYFSYRPAGGSWGANVKVNDDAGDAQPQPPSIAVDAFGNAYAVWGDQRNGSAYVYFSYRPAGGSWGANQPVSDGSTGWDMGGGHPAIAVDPLGNAYAVWEDKRNPPPDDPSTEWSIYFSYRPAGGSWGANERINGTGNCWRGNLEVDVEGNVHVVWTCHSPFSSNDGVYYSRRTPSGDWSPVEQINDPLGGALPYPQWADMTLDPDGSPWAIWADDRTATGSTVDSDWQIYSSYRPVTFGDSDQDGLSDKWEQDGIDIDGDGSVDLDLPAIGADPLHKDIFVEIDYMEHHQPDVDAIQDVIDAFAAAPVSNPDNQDGINLHLLVDDQIQHQDAITMWADFDTINDGHFGTSAERSNPNWENIRSARRLVFRYGLFVHQYSLYPSSSGLAELGGDNFIVSLGAPGWGTDANGHSVGTRDEQAATFMHELGHTLALRHGGVDDTNCKPNYLSVMSYSRQFSWFVPGRPLDYSRACLPTLVENDLDEWLGVQGDSSVLTVYADGYGGFRIAQTSGAIDWDGDGFMEGESVAGDNVHVNINNLGFAGCEDAADTQALTGYDDWGNLLYSFKGSPNYPEGVHILVADPEITTEVVEAMRQLADFQQNVYLPLAVRNR